MPQQDPNSTPTPGVDPVPSNPGLQDLINQFGVSHPTWITNPSQIPANQTVISGSWVYTSDGKGGWSAQKATPTINPATANLDYARMFQEIGLHQIDLGNGTSLSVITPEDPTNPGHPLIDQNTGLPMLLTTDGSPLFGKDSNGNVSIGDAAKQGLMDKNKLTEAQTSDILGKLQPTIDQIENAAGESKSRANLYGSQANLTNVQTEAAKQQLLGQFSTAASQIASGPGDVASKQKMLDTLYDSTINQYNDVVSKSAALNTYQNTAVTQANQRAATAAGSINNIISGLMGRKGSIARGAIAGLLGDMPNYISALGGSPVNLQNPLSLWATGPSGIDISSVPTLDQLFPKQQSTTSQQPTTKGPVASTPPPAANPQTALDAWNNGATRDLNTVPSQPAPNPLSNWVNTFDPNAPTGSVPYAANLFGNQNSIVKDPNSAINPANLIKPLIPTNNLGITPIDINTTPSLLSLVQNAINNNPVSNPASIPGLTGFNSFGQNPPNNTNNGQPLSMGTGGTVPGSPGQPQLAIVHGGEKITRKPVLPNHPVTPVHLEQIRQQVAQGRTPLQAVLNVHAASGGDPAALLKAIKKGNK